ncbi:MAG TPA: glucosamine-6-phosphate deaminase [Candidatus Eubacterium faecipullorum]|uniref:Glucosamine-6-phosphate deaminase n=1 Tax=Candidatus Eubacterium faecipullorum TaxID=2838571 RepID=A0A9D1RCV5_9FIRM|nr:glucosamine-6-phosphate deaminase [Candidatus Eubacterium faecipullorum]
MNVLIYNTEEQIGIAAGNYMCGQVLQKPNSVLGLATGSTPLKPYSQMIELYKKGVVDFSKVTTFNLDEYVNLDVNDKNSYHSFMHENLFDHINIPAENINFLDGNAKDPEEECRRYEEKIKAAGGIDIQLLGIGSNGHIAFNEPADCFQRWSHVVTLKESTVKDNSRFFKSIDEVPTQALTMGIGSIMQAKKILIIAIGENKAKAIKQLIDGNVTPMCPASVLQFHTDVTLMLDKAAASLI